MSGKTLNTRIQNKRGTTAEWATGTAPNFVPKDGEIVAYTDVHRIKIGDGNTKVSALPFVDNKIPENLTDGVLPAWNSTSKKLEDSYCRNTIDGLFVEGNIDMGSYEYSLGLDVQDGSFSYSDDGQNTIKKYALPITKDSGTLATMYKRYKKFAAFAVGDNLSGKTLLFNTDAVFQQYFGVSITIATSSGGYTLSTASGPPNFRLLKNGTVVQEFTTWGMRPDGTTNAVWGMQSYTLPSDFGTVSTLNTASGGSTYTSIWNTLGLDGATAEYDLINVEDAYQAIPKIVDNLITTNASAALSATQGYKLNSDKAPKASPTFTGTVTLSGTTTPLSVSSSVGAAGQVLTSQGMGKSPTWKDVSLPTNYVTTDTEQTINIQKTFAKNITFNGQSADTYLFDCYANDGQSDTIVGVYLNTIDSSSGKSKGELKLGDGSAECAISLKNSYGTSGQVLTSQGEGKTPIWKTFTASAPSNMVTTDTIQTISSLKYFSGTQAFQGRVQISNGGSGIEIFNTGDSFAVSLVIDESNGLPEDGADVHLPVVDRQLVGNLYLIGAVSNGTKGQVLTSAGVARAATWSTLPEFAMNTALPISYRLSSSSNGYYNGVSYGTASTVNCLMTRDVPDHASLNRHISYCIHLSTTITAGKWVRFDVPSISYNNTTYWPYIKTITATPIKTSTSSTSPAIVTYITNNQSSGGYAYVGCCSQQINGLDVRIDCTVS